MPLKKKAMPLYVALSVLLLILPADSAQAKNKTDIVIVESPKSPTTASLTIKTNVSGVDVYLNNVYKGYTPLTLNEIIPGTYNILLEKNGWANKTIPVLLAAQTETRLYVELLPITGFLRINSENGNANIYLNGELVTMSSTINSVVIEVSEGYHTVEIRKFGWQASAETVYVFKNTLTEVDLHMKKALFEIQELLSHPQQFNPSNSGILGQAHFYFTVTTPSSGILKIRDLNGNQVYEKKLTPFTTWKQSFSWDGRTTSGKVLNEGIYIVEIEAKPAEGWGISQNAFSEFDTNEKKPTLFVRETTQIIIDNSIFYPIGTISAGGTSNGTIPSPLFMPQGTIFFSFNGLTDFSLNSGFTATPLMTSVAITPFPWMELSFRLGLEARSSSFIPAIFGAAIKFASKTDSLYLGGIVRYTYASERTNVPTFSEAGLATGILAGIQMDSLFIAVSEEAVFGPKQGIFDTFDGHLKTGLSISFQSGSFSASLWGALYSPFDNYGIKAFDLLHCGTDFLFLMPNSTVIPSIGFGYTYTKEAEHNIEIRFGLGILNL